MEWEARKQLHIYFCCCHWWREWKLHSLIFLFCSHWQIYTTQKQNTDLINVSLIHQLGPLNPVTGQTHSTTSPYLTRTSVIHKSGPLVIMTCLLPGIVLSPSSFGPLIMGLYPCLAAETFFFLHWVTYNLHDNYKKKSNIVICLVNWTGMVFNKGEILIKMEFMERHAPSLQGRTSPTHFKSKIRLEVSSISHLLLSTRQLVVLVQSKSLADQESLSHFLNQLLITVFLLVIGTKSITR